MNKIVFIAIVFFFGLFPVFSQQNKMLYDIAGLSVESKYVESLREVMLYELLEIEKKGFLKDFDSITGAYHDAFEKFYANNYTDIEIEGMGVFYHSNGGKKLLSIKKHLEESFIQRDKDYPQFVVKDCIDKSLYKAMEELVQITGLHEFLAAAKEDEMQWLNSQHISAFEMEFDSLRKPYLQYAKEYFFVSLRKDEIEEILNFYKTPLGKKMASMALLYYRLKFKAFNDWNDAFIVLHRNLTFGKYQKP